MKSSSTESWWGTGGEQVNEEGSRYLSQLLRHRIDVYVQYTSIRRFETVRVLILLPRQIACKKPRQIKCKVTLWMEAKMAERVEARKNAEALEDRIRVIRDAQRRLDAVL